MPRHKTPTALKALAGNPGKRPLPDSEPIFTNTDEKPPVWLNDEAKELWHIYSGQLAANGMLNAANRDILAIYCHAMRAYIERIESGEAPQLGRLQQLRLLAREFGFTPSSQSGIVVPAKTETDAKNRFFN